MPFPTRPCGLETSYYPDHSRYQKPSRLGCRLLGLVLAAALARLLLAFPYKFCC